MDEAKRRQIERAATELTKNLIDQGKLIEAGFAAFASYVIPPNAPATQLREMQLAWMAGAEHVWSSVMGMLDPGEEPSEADLRRMGLIQQEIDKWRTKISERIDHAKGNA